LVVPGVNDHPLSDVDLTAAFVGEFGNLTRITVQTSAGWTTGQMVLTFSVRQGPSSLPASTAHGQAFTLTINGSSASGAAGANAATTPDGLRIDVPSKTLGATGGDLLAGLNITTSRTDPGQLQGVAQDDQTATDSAGPGKAYTFTRPPVTAHIRIEAAGPSTVEGTGQHLTIPFRLSNDGLDPDSATLTLNATGLLGSLPSGAPTQTFTLPPASSRTVNVTIESAPDGHLGTPGDHAVTVRATSTLGGSSQAHVTVHIPAAATPPPTERAVKPAGLGFLSKTAESMGLDDAFGSYAEAALLGLIVLLVIVAIFLLLAVGRTTMAAEAATVAPWPEDAPRPRTLAAAGPAGISETVRATPASSAPAATEPEDDAGALAALLAEPAPEAAPLPAVVAPLPTAATGARIRIEEVRHTPREPEAGQAVSTEVILRNEGPSTTLRISLSVDGKPAAERTVQVPSRATKAVELPWTAGAGDNRVRIQAFPA
jgi:hypothetical protein